MTPVLAAVEPSEAEARRLLEHELDKSEYAEAGPTLMERLMRWLAEHTPDSDGLPVPLAWLLIVLVLVVVLVIVLRVVGPARFASRADETASAVFGEDALPAHEHRRRAAEHAAAQQWTDAVREQFRALVRGLTERTVVDDRPGLTADEAAREAGSRMPQLGQDLAAAARLFDAVSFGGRTGDEAAYQRVRDLDVRAERTTALAHGAAVGGTLVVPR